MRLFKETIKSILLIGILSSFLMSTSGFVLTRHICSHHSTEIVLSEGSIGCCAVEKEEAKTASCCSSKQASTKEGSEDCCQFEKTYIRLSENFISSEKTDFSKEAQIYSTCALNTIIPATDELAPPVKAINFKQEKFPKAKKYLLFHQVKLEPPLV